MKILAIDDEKDTLDFLKSVLTEAGHKVAPAGTAGEAMVYVQLERFDAILLDLMMPGLDGLEFQRWVRDHWDIADVPIVVISCLTDADSKSRARMGGCVEYLTKPFELERLFEALARIERGQAEGAAV